MHHNALSNFLNKFFVLGYVQRLLPRTLQLSALKGKKLEKNFPTRNDEKKNFQTRQRPYQIVL